MNPDGFYQTLSIAQHLKTTQHLSPPPSSPSPQAAGTVTRQALLIGYSEGMMRTLPGLLNRAGFDVAVLTTAIRFKPKGHLRVLKQVESAERLLTEARAWSRQPFDLIVIGDDQVLRDVVASDWDVESKLRVLPVCSETNFAHIGSKIGLAEVLASAGIPAPSYAIAYNPAELTHVLSELPYPALIKIDQSGGGSGVFPFGDPNDFPGQAKDSVIEVIDKVEQYQERLLEAFFRKQQEALATNRQQGPITAVPPSAYPVLVQERIPGEAIDVSACFLAGELVHFSYSEMIAFISNAFGPSLLRTYYRRDTLPGEVLAHLRRLGRALGANGFVNITCIRDARDGQHYFVEADMRPNTWVDYGKYLNDDPANALRVYLEQLDRIKTLPSRGTQQAPHTFSPLNVDCSPQVPTRLRIPYVFRMSAWGVLTNRYGVWRFCEGFTTADLIRHVLSQPIQFIKQRAIAYVKPRVSIQTWERLKLTWRWLNTLGP